MRIFISTLAYLVICLSCTPSGGEKQLLEPSKTLEIPAQGFNFNQLLSIDTYNYKSNPHLVFLDISGNYLSYNLEEAKVDTLLNFNQNFRAYGSISALSHINQDSVLMVFRDANTVAIWNRKSMKLEPVAEVRDFLFQFMQGSYQGLPNISLLPTLVDPPRFIQGKYYIPKEIALPIDPNSRVNAKGEKTENDRSAEEYEEKMRDFSFLKEEASYITIDPKKETSKWITVATHLMPQNYFGSKTFLPMGHFRSNTVGVDQELLISHFSSHEISVIKTNGERKRIKSVKSKYIKDFSPIPFSEIREESKERMVTQPYYGALHYDPYRELYYRFAIHKQPYLKKDKVKVNSNRDRSFSILVFDSDFTVLREHFFEPNTYVSSSSFVAQNGLYIRSIESEKGKITYHAFEL